MNEQKVKLSDEILKTPLPEKQGLKPISGIAGRLAFALKTPLPEKQGLKQSIDRESTNQSCLKTPLPEKQGLKPRANAL